VLTRRQLLLSTLALWLSRPPRALATVAETQSTYQLDLGLLYDMLRFRLTGTIAESVDRAGGRCVLGLRGEGDGIENRSDSVGVLRDGRWAPLRSSLRVVVLGRESHLDVTYDHDARLIRYRGRGETFLLRRLRLVDDVVHVPAGVHVDDAGTALLNFAEGRWPARADGRLATHVVRRRRAPGEGPDDLQTSYRAELVPLVLTLDTDGGGRETTASFDLGGLSSWARADRPARIVFGADRRPRRLVSSLILGTSLSVRVDAVRL
jgi:hypothetical protein